MRLLFALLFARLALCAADPAAPEYGIQIVRTYPHDPASFTQGLEFRAGVLYESTGLEGRSKLRRVKLETGQVLQEIRLPATTFGEGITVLNGQIVQLTYKEQTGFVYRQSDFQLLRRFSYPGEGWGLANDGQRIYMSDGSAQIRVWDPASLREQKRLTVRDRGQQVVYLNELEWVRGEIYANVWQTERIARISPADGRVLGWIDLSTLPPREPGADVLNGIAYDPMGDRLFVTGKLWSKLFEIRVVPKARR